jgi:hypothetical protein
MCVCACVCVCVCVCVCEISLFFISPGHEEPHINISVEGAHLHADTEPDKTQDRIFT